MENTGLQYDMSFLEKMELEVEAWGRQNSKDVIRIIQEQESIARDDLQFEVAAALRYAWKVAEAENKIYTVLNELYPDGLFKEDYPTRIIKILHKAKENES